MCERETRIVLHIGMHKTGTSSIERFLHRNSERLLRESGVYYPDAGRTEHQPPHESHYILAWESVERYGSKYAVQRSDRHWRQLRDEVQRVCPAVAVVSSEFFWPATEKEIQEIARHVSGMNVLVVLYVRNQLQLATSSYKQSVKTGSRAERFDAFLQEWSRRYDFAAVADRWSNVFGRDRLLIRIYDKVKDYLIEDFAHVCGFTASGSEARTESNVSPSDGVIRLIRSLNVLEQRVLGHNPLIRKTRRNILARRMPGALACAVADSFSHRRIVQDTHVEYLRSATSETRRRFLEEYVAPEDHHFLEF